MLLYVIYVIVYLFGVVKYLREREIGERALISIL